VMTFGPNDPKRVWRVGAKGWSVRPQDCIGAKTRFIDFRPQRHGRDAADCKAQAFDSSASPLGGKSRRQNVVVGKRRPPNVDLPARWAAAGRAGPTGIGLHANRTP